MTVDPIILFNIVNCLDSHKAIAENLAQELEDGDSIEIVEALSNVVMARGIANIALKAGLSNDIIHKAIAPDADPCFEVVNAIVRAAYFKSAAISVRK